MERFLLLAAWYGLVAAGVEVVFRQAIRPRRACFDSRYPLDDAVLRLREWSLKPGQATRNFERLRGRVGTTVVLERATPRPREVFVEFRGAFVQRDGRVVLEGRFGAPLSTRLALGFVLATFLAVLALAATGNRAALPMIMIALTVLAAVAWIVKVKLDASAEEIRWISGALREALGG